jgi:hypothetical protein
MRAEAMPGEDKESLAHPSELAPCLLDLAAPENKDTGLLYDFPSKELRSFFQVTS